MATVMSLAARLRRLERHVPPRWPAHVEWWITSGGMSENPETGEVIPEAELAVRPHRDPGPGITRIEWVLYSPLPYED
jgi:hypothetical protein